MSTPREGPGSVVLDGRWIMVGGYAGGKGGDRDYTAIVERFDPVANAWSRLKPLSIGRGALAVASDEATGTIAITGGGIASGILDIPTTMAEIGPPDAWTLTEMEYARYGHSLTCVNGEFLAAGGWGPALVEQAELYDRTGHWSLVGSMPGGARARHTSTALRGTSYALLVGGSGGVGGVRATCDMFDFATRLWRPRGSLLHGRAAHCAEQLLDGRVVVTGGLDLRKVLSSVEVYDPTSDKWTEAPPMRVARYDHAMVLLPDGRVLVAGGSTDPVEIKDGVLDSVEIYDPTSNAWTDGPSLREARALATGVVLNDAVYVGGGTDASGPLASVERLPLSALPARVSVGADAGTSVGEGAAPSSPGVMGGGGCSSGVRGPGPADGMARMALVVSTFVILQYRRTRLRRKTQS